MEMNMTAWFCPKSRCRSVPSGRNTRANGFAQGELCHTLGSYIPFAKTAEERKASNDSRFSIAERYRDNDDYRSRLRDVADHLVADRLLLRTDADSYAHFVLPK
jgi:hypothetical protein